MKYHWSNFKHIKPSELNAIYHTPSCLLGINNVSEKYRAHSYSQLKQYWFDNIDRHIYSNYNVPILKILKFMSIEYKEVTRPGWDAAVKTDNAWACIWVNESLTIQQKSFLAAQMLGILLLSGDILKNLEYKTFYCSFPVNFKNDKKSWEFAAELLMPMYLVNTVYKTLPGLGISFTNKFKSLYDINIRKQNKEIKEHYYNNWLGLMAGILNVPTEVLAFHMNKNYSLGV